MKFEDELHKELGLCYALPNEVAWAEKGVEMFKQRVRDVILQNTKMALMQKDGDWWWVNRTKIFEELGL